MSATATLIRRVQALPPAQQSRAVECWRRLHADPARAAARVLAAADDPERYAREILGESILTRRQLQGLQAVCDAVTGRGLRRILYLGGNGTGKTYGEAIAILWAWHARGFMPADDGEPGGCGIVFTAPTAGSLEDTIYRAVLAAAGRAARRGYPPPGWAPRPVDRYRGASPSSVTWWEGERWWMVAVTPRREAKGDVAHSGAGRHHPHLQIVALEEASGVDAGMVAAAAGLAVAANAIEIASTNPTSRRSAIYSVVAHQAQDLWARVPHSQLDHPNVVERRAVIPGSVDHLTLEAALRSQAFEQRPRGADLDPAHLDFLYACPDKGTPDTPGPRKDGVPGHPLAEVRVYRPATAMAAGTHLGDWLAADEAGLLYPIRLIEEQMLCGAPAPERKPDQVGVDCHPARPPVAVPRWGPTARTAIDTEPPPDTVPITLGPAVEIAWPPGHPHEQGRAAAADLVARFGAAALYVLDRAAGGEVGQALDALGARVEYVLFGAPPASPALEHHAPAKNRRAEMGLEAAAALRAGLVALPYSAALIRQMEAIGAAIDDGKTVVLRSKEKIERETGLGMDELDALWLAVALATRRSVYG